MEIVNEIVMVPIAKIKPYHRNVRKNDVTVDKLVQIIPKVGFNVPIVIDFDNVIVKGHSRWKAAIKLGMKSVPCVYSSADEETIKLDRLSDNKVQEFTEWDNELLKSELASLNLPFDFNFNDLNFKFELPSFNTYTPPPTSYAPPVSPYTGEEMTSGYNQPDYGYQAPSYPSAAPQPYSPPTPYITQADVERSVPKIVQDYHECTCPKCGETFYKRI